MSRRDLETVNKLMLLQGISLIQDGLQFLEHMTDYVNETSFDALTILKDRFQYFKESVLSDDNCDTMFIDRARNNLENVDYGYKLNKKIKDELTTLKRTVIEERKKYAEK